MRRSSILMIYTGGTIGMKQDPQDMTLKPFDFHQILDGPQRKGDLRRSRAGACNIVPNSTGAAKAIGFRNS